MIASARRVAYQILLRIATSDAHSDDLLRSPEVDALSALDRNLTTTLVLGTLRWQLALDAQIRPFLAQPDRQLSPEAATALRLGAYQLFHLERVPPHAVLNDSVELIKQGKERGAAGMVNAVLRKVQAGEPRAQVTKPKSAADLAAAFAHPLWMVERWARRYGMAAAEAICRWDQEPAGATLRLASPEADLDGLETEPGFFLAGSRRLLRGDPGRSPAFREGRLRIQDEASQLVAELLAAADPKSGQPTARVLDTCAAPGGKTAILAERLPESAITALDISQKRLAAMVLAAQAGRFAAHRRHPIHFEAADAATRQLQPEWDLILCDVPCSGTGTMARNPEIRLRITEAGELQRQQARQIAILRAALRGLKPGGRLVYSTCSLEPEENEAVVEAVVRNAPEARIEPVAGILDRLAEQGIVTPQGRERLWQATEGDFLRTLPGVHPCDGFFAAILEGQQTS